MTSCCCRRSATCSVSAASDPPRSGRRRHLPVRRLLPDQPLVVVLGVVGLLAPAAVGVVGGLVGQQLVVVPLLLAHAHQARRPAHREGVRVHHRRWLASAPTSRAKVRQLWPDRWSGSCDGSRAESQARSGSSPGTGGARSSGGSPRPSASATRPGAAWPKAPEPRSTSATAPTS